MPTPFALVKRPPERYGEGVPHYDLMSLPERHHPWRASVDERGHRCYVPDFPHGLVNQSGGRHRMSAQEGHLYLDSGSHTSPDPSMRDAARAIALRPDWLPDLADSLTRWLAGGFHHGEFHDRVWLRREVFDWETWPPFGGYGQTYDGPTLAVAFPRGLAGAFRFEARRRWLGRSGDSRVFKVPEARLLLADVTSIVGMLADDRGLAEAIASLPDLDSRSLDPNPPRARPNDLRQLLTGQRQTIRGGGVRSARAGMPVACPGE